MSSVLPASSSAGLSGSGLERGPLRGLGRRHAILVVLFALLTPLSFTLFGRALGEPVHLPFVAFEVVSCLLIGAAAVLSAIVSDNTLRTRVGPVWRLGIAILAAGACGTVLVEIAGFALAGPLGLEQLMALEGKTFAGAGQRIAYEFAGAARWALMLVVLYELFESNRRAAGQLRAARLAALAAQHGVVEGELRTMQARVDPDLLFDSLLEIDRGYARDLGTGEERLDALIRFLRAALPGDGSASSTVEREQELAEAYVALAGLRGAQELRLGLSIDPASRQEPIPPMLLLPLLRWALADSSARRIHLAVERSASGLTLSVESAVSEDGAPPGADIDAVRERLAQLFAQDARLSAHAARGKRRAVLEIPRLQLAAGDFARAA